MLSAAVSYAQTAQATMRVSVRVVSGSSIKLEQPAAVYLQPNQTTSLGRLKLRGTKDQEVLIKSDNTVQLDDGKGNRVSLSVDSRYNINSEDEQVSYETKSVQGNLASGIYTGKLTTTIEYL